MINFNNLIKSGINIIQIVSYENEMVDGEVHRAASELKRDWYKWNCSSGLKKFNGKNFDIIENLEDSVAILDWYESNEAKDSILILEEFNLHLMDNRLLISKMRDIISKSYKDRSLIMFQTKKEFPPELEKEIYIEEMDLPSRKDLKTIFDRVCKDYNIKPEGNIEKIIESALGLTTMEARRGFSKAIVQTGQLSEKEISIIIQEKENIIKNSGYLEYYHHRETLDDVGGLDILKNWLKRRGRAFEEKAKEYGLETPRGILLLGIPGTGKSLCAKAVGSAWQFPIIKLDMGKIFGRFVGESESNIRKALKIAEAISPSVLWIDEIEKGLSGSASGSSDGGTTPRVFGTFLTWMQEKKKPVFVVATANNVDKLPPELLRKGRVDEIFFVDLPSREDREEIIKIHLKRVKRDYNKFDISKIADACKEFSGAEIEEAIKEALFRAFDEDKEISTEHIIEAMKKTYPLSKTMKEDINKMKNWAKDRAVLASSKKEDKQLKQEDYNNDFISGK